MVGALKWLALGLVKLVLLLLTISASTCLHHSRNHVRAICRRRAQKKILLLCCLRLKLVHIQGSAKGSSQVWRILLLLLLLHAEFMQPGDHQKVVPSRALYYMGSFNFCSNMESKQPCVQTGWGDRMSNHSITPSCLNAG